MKSIELHLDTFTHCTLLQQCAVHWIVLRQSFLSSLIIFTVGVIAITFGTDLLPAEYFAMALSYAIQLSNYIKSYVRQTAATEAQFVSVQRVKEYTEMNVSPDVVDSVARTQLSTMQYDVSMVIIAPALEFRNVYLKYEFGPLALKNVSFVVNPGERIGVVGRTG
jgi:ABC-type multidrug transport system fused ATPase/permease subunit